MKSLVVIHAKGTLILKESILFCNGIALMYGVFFSPLKFHIVVYMKKATPLWETRITPSKMIIFMINNPINTLLLLSQPLKSKENLGYTLSSTQNRLCSNHHDCPSTLFYKTQFTNLIFIDSDLFFSIILASGWTSDSTSILFYFYYFSSNSWCFLELFRLEFSLSCSYISCMT